jgi:hypothetical protein
MTSDIISICAGILGLAYLVVVGNYFETTPARKRKHASASYGFGPRRQQPVRVRHSR